MALPQERIQLAEELWDSLLESPEQVPLTPAQEAELDRRREGYRQDREPAEPWREALAKIGKGGRRAASVVLSRSCGSSRPGMKEEGLLKPEKPLALTPGERVALLVVRHPDPNRWDLGRLAKSGEREDRALAGQGLAEWADALDREDQSGGP